LNWTIEVSGVPTAMGNGTYVLPAGGQLGNTANGFGQIRVWLHVNPSAPMGTVPPFSITIEGNTA